MPEPLPPSGRISIPVPHGSLEAIVRAPDAPIAAAVVCHPHPLGGGTMNNNVVYRLAKALVEAGVVTLRFNFRGVGASTGTHAHGIGEEDDARAALSWMQARHPDLPLWMTGFSFGARVGLAVGGGDARVAKLLGVGLALRMFDYRFLVGCAKPKAFIQAADDEYGGRADIEAAVDTMSPPKRLWVVDAATHLFPGRLDAFESAAREAVEFLKSI
jgi:alpha/beta superfamily hydrolase